MSKLLVSVRSTQEAAHALAGGADVIDVKEPRLGSLGRADDAVIAAVVEHVAGRVPVSAALGELLEESPSSSLPCLRGLSFVKYGLAGCGRVPHWRSFLANVADSFARPSLALRVGVEPDSEGCQFVYVAYADWQCAAAPPLSDVVDQACLAAGGVLLLDTHCKTAATISLGRMPTLLDWLAIEDVLAVCERCRACQVRVALAGSLGPQEIRLLLPARPTWFAVRGAVCDDGREGAVQESRVRELARLVRGGTIY